MQAEKSKNSYLPIEFIRRKERAKEKRRKEREGRGRGRGGEERGEKKRQGKKKGTKRGSGERNKVECDFMGLVHSNALRG